MKNIMWFRRDLRLNDNHALSLALKAGEVLPVFIFDTDILHLLNEDDQRIGFIHREVCRLHEQLAAMGSGLLVRHGRPVDIFRELLTINRVAAVYCNNDYEPYARRRDGEVKELCAAMGAGFISVKDHVVFEPGRVLKPDGRPYTVFTPYSRKWLEHFKGESLAVYGSAGTYCKRVNEIIPSVEELGFRKPVVEYPSPVVLPGLLENYARQRDFPGVAGTSRLGIHLRFGTISIRNLVRTAEGSPVFLNELIWREFYQSILWHFPHVVHQAFKPAYDNIPWRNSEQEFERWCAGQTGYPIVDAGMRELNATGFMHNRVRMITASFLCKHLLIDWRWGESYFAAKLLDYELASNNGGWQWAAGSGCDAAPYFRVFNPALQAKKFDPGHTYIRKWVPEFDTNDYPAPLVQHEFARQRCLEVYKKALQQ